MSLFCLNVDFAEKEIVKQLGARWCNELKTWYINDDYVNPTDFIKWIPKIIDNEFSYLYEIDFEDPDCNYRVVMKVKSKKDLSNYKYFFNKRQFSPKYQNMNKFIQKKHLTVTFHTLPIHKLLIT